MRRGIAATETALLLPIMVAIGFAGIEFANGFYLRQSLTLGAYEAATVLSEPQSTLSVAESTCENILQARNVSQFTMNVTPNPSTTIAPGDFITVTVSSPASAFSLGPAFFLHDENVVASVTVVRTP